MWNSIVYMQQIKVIIFYYIHHRTGQGRFIRRVIKQRISRYLYFVIKYIGYKTIEPYGLLVSNKMNHMTFLSKGLS